MPRRQVAKIILIIAGIILVGVFAPACFGDEEEGRETAVPTQTPTLQPRVTPTPLPTVATPPEGTPVPTEAGVPPTPFSGPTDVFTTDKINVRAGPGLAYVSLEIQPINTLGEIKSGPEQADGYTWWEIEWENGVRGWSAQDWLKIGKWPAVTECDFSKPIDLRKTEKFGIFGDDQFDTLVCGYLMLKDEEVWEVQQTNAYLTIVDYADPGFIASVDAGIEMGNSVNQKGPRFYEFNLGCAKGGEIVGFEREDGKPYIDSDTKAAILNSSPESLVSLVLSFGIHGGSGCTCCNLAHKIRLYQ